MKLRHFLKHTKNPQIQLRESERSRGSADTSTYGDTDKNRGRDEAPAKYKHHACRVAANSSHTHAPLRPRSLSLVHAVVCTLQWPGPPHSPTLKRSRGQSLVALSHVWVWRGKKACDPRMKRKKTKRDWGRGGAEKAGLLQAGADENTDTAACSRPTTLFGIRVSRCRDFCGSWQARGQINTPA